MAANGIRVLMVALLGAAFRSKVLLESELGPSNVSIQTAAHTKQGPLKLANISNLGILTHTQLQIYFNK